MISRNKLRNISKKIKNSAWEISLVVLLITVGIFLRTYHFSSWLHFEVDQTWDYTIVSHAVTDGIGNLPLLGPTAGGGRALRLGPSFYYLEYLSALVFGNTPVGHAIDVLILSILTLPIFYLFIRKYFSKEVSIGLLAIVATSLYFVIYSRFSWSPNVLPFFILLTMYALLRSVSKEEIHSQKWFLIMVASLSITTQIHFNSFFVIPAVVATFLLIRRPRLNWKTWVAAFGIVLFVYMPMIASEIKTHGEDTQFFLEKVSTPGKHGKPFIDKTFIDVQYNIYEYFLIISGNDQINASRPATFNYLGLACTKNCGLASRIPARVIAIISFLFALVLLVRNLIKEPKGQRKDFLILTSLWLIFSYLYFFKIYDSNTLFPRFFLIVSPLAVVLFGYILEFLRPEKNKLRLATMAIIIGAVTWSNASGIIHYFKDLKNAAITSQSMKVKDVFPFNERATYEQLQAVANYIADNSRNGYPVFIQSDHEYASTLWYLLGLRNIYPDFTTGPAPARANYFSVVRTTFVNPQAADRQTKGFSLGNSQYFGGITVYPLIPQPGAALDDNAENSAQYFKDQHAQISEILTWNELFRKPAEKQTDSIDTTQDTGNPDNSEDIAE